MTTGFVVIGVAAHHLRRGALVAECRRMLSMTLWLLTALVPMQSFIGDMHGLNTVQHQPAKIAAIEGHGRRRRRAPRRCWHGPTSKAEATVGRRDSQLGSLILTHDSMARCAG